MYIYSTQQLFNPSACDMININVPKFHVIDMLQYGIISSSLWNIMTETSNDIIVINKLYYFFERILYYIHYMHKVFH